MGERKENVSIISISCIFQNVTEGTDSEDFCLVRDFLEFIKSL